MTNNPFEEFGKERWAAEEVAKKEAEVSGKIEWERAQHEQKVNRVRGEEKEKYRPMVVEVLNHLINAAYPGSKVSLHPFSVTTGKFLDGYQIVHIIDTSLPTDGPGLGLTEIEDVRVELGFDSEGMSTHFECTVWLQDNNQESKTLNANLDYESLVSKLTELQRWRVKESERRVKARREEIAREEKKAKSWFGRLFG